MINVRTLPARKHISLPIWNLASIWNVAIVGAFLLANSGLLLLSMEAYQHSFLAGDPEISEWVQSIHFRGLGIVLRIVNFMTDAHPAIATWLFGTAFFLLRGRPLEALAIFCIPGVWIVGEALSRVVGGTFPSGHTTHAVTFFGLLSVQTWAVVRRGYLRIVVPSLAVTVVALTSLGRVYVGDHLPSDILGSYLLGFIGLVTIAFLYTLVRENRLHLPHFLRRRGTPAQGDRRIARSIASIVYLDPQAGTATKEYNPPWPVRGLYWLAFQAPFPYQHRRAALEAAVAKRAIAGLLTRHQFGYDMVAPIYEIRNGRNGYQLASQFIPGAAPRSNKEVEEVLSQMYSYFQEVGLPTWQIAPGNPHAHSNFIRTPAGELTLIDLESTLISISPSWKQLGPSLRDGRFPAFDDVDFLQLRGYVQQHGPGLLASLGQSGFLELHEAIDTAERTTQTWKESEPMIWGRMLRRVHRLLVPSGTINTMRRRLDGAIVMARSFLHEAVDRWEREGHINSERAVSLRQILSTPAAGALLKHLGAHLVLSVALRFPFGSLARFAWVLAFRVKARVDFSQGKVTWEGLQAARSLHTIPVMLFSLVPGLGAVAYLASGTMIKMGIARMLMDQFAYKLPLRLYDRLGLARITAPRPLQPATGRRLFHDPER